MPTDLSTEQAESRQTPSVGATLRQTRRDQDLSEKDVADRLHITMHYVKALETDRHEKLPGTIFVKGYIRNYAELLGLDSAALLADYEAGQVGSRGLQEQPAVQEVRRRRDRNHPFVLASVVMFIGVFAGLWIVSHWGEEASPPSEQVPTAAGGSDDGDSRQATARDAAMLQPATTLPAQAVPTDAILAAATGDVPAASTEVPRFERPVVTAQQPRSPGVSTAQSAADKQVTETDAQLQPGAATVDETVGGESLIEVQGSGGDVLRISFAGASWVEVNDGSRQQIYRDLRQAGDILKITGDGPFNVLLGDAPRARLEFNGDEVDVSDDIRVDNSARLTVGL